MNVPDYLHKPCRSPKDGGIKAFLVMPWPTENKSDAVILSEAEPFLQIGDAMAEKGESVHFGKDVVYHKLADNEGGF